MSEIPATASGGKSADLRIELGTALQVQFVGSEDTVRGTLVGLDKGFYLIVRVPSIPGIWTRVHKEDQVVIRYLYRGTVYGFRSTLLNVVKEPSHLVFLSYPKTVEAINLRKQERVSCLIPAQTSINGVLVKGVIVDMSLGGCCLSCNLDLDEGSPEVKAGDEIVLAFQIVGTPGERMVDAKVMNVRRQGQKIMIGNLFSEVDHETVSVIENYIGSVNE
jgi:c-di-GMP-binding flagellar brake protein YcgR